MGVQCDHCEREATVHEVVVRDGKRLERHLCEEHARDLGVFQPQSHAGVGQIVKKVVMSQSGGAAAQTQSAMRCGECGMTFAKFRQQGLLGCPACYRAFEDKLAPLLARAHDNGDRHKGKVPRRAGSSLARQEMLAELRRELQSAVESEQYERAATLRDEIGLLESGRAPSDLGEPHEERS